MTDQLDRVVAPHTEVPHVGLPPMRRLDGRAILRRVTADGFSRNTLCMTASTLTLGVGGLIFWAVASHLYRVAQVGVATSVIAGLTLITTLSSIGWPQLGMRDGRSYVRGAQIALRGAIFTSVAGVIMVGVVILAPGHLGLAVDQVGSAYRPLLVVSVMTVVLSSIGSCAEGVLVSRHGAHMVLCDSVAGTIVRLAALPFLTAHGVLGVLLANAMAAGVSAAVAWACVIVSEHHEPALPGPCPAITWSADGRFAMTAGLPAAISLLPTAILPSVVLHELGAESAAFFSISLALASAVRLLPSVVSQTMLAEVGRGDDPQRLLRKALKLISCVSTFVCLVVVAAHTLILDLYGHTVADGAGPVLIVLVISGAAAGTNYLVDGTMLAIGELRRFTWVNVAGTVVVIACVSLGSLFSLELAATGYLLAELLYAGVSWQALRTSKAWHAAALNSEITAAELRPRHRRKSGRSNRRSVVAPSGDRVLRLRYVDGLRESVGSESSCWGESSE